MLSCFSVPVGSLHVILWHTFAILVHLPQIVLCVRVTLSRRSAQPLQCFLKVGLSKPALLISCAEPKLCICVACLGSNQEIFPMFFGPSFALQRGCCNPHDKGQIITLVVPRDLPTSERRKVDTDHHGRRLRGYAVAVVCHERRGLSI